MSTTSNVINGWFRAENIVTGHVIDINPRNPEHMTLWARLQLQTTWAITVDRRENPLSDDPTEPLTPYTLE